MNLTTATDPVRHFICDAFVTPTKFWTVPPADSPGAWEVVYDNDCERRKRTTRNVSGWSADVVRRMHSLDVLKACSQLFGTVAHPDTLLWGGGLQVIAPGGWLNCHLDGQIHPQQPRLRRAVQLVCFCHYEWRPEWGGELAFFNPGGAVVQLIEPLPGRLVAFEACHDLAYHGVLPVSSHAADRISIATSLLADARPTDTRQRALFLPYRAPRYARP